MRIDIPIFDLEGDEITEPIEWYILFEEHYIQERCQWYNNKTIEDEGIKIKHEDILEFYCLTTLRDSFKAVEFNHAYRAKGPDGELTECYSVSLLFVSVNAIHTRFKSEKEAMEFYEICVKYLTRE